MGKKLLVIIIALLVLITSISEASGRYEVPPVALSVTLSDENNVPMDYVRVNLMIPSVSGPIATATTMKGGVAVFNNLKLYQSGQYYFFARMAPYLPYSQSFTGRQDTIYISELHNIDVTKNNSIHLQFDSTKKVIIWKTSATYFKYFYIRSVAEPRLFVKFNVDSTSSLLFIYAPMNRMYQIITSDSDEMISEQMIWWDYYAVSDLVVTI